MRRHPAKHELFALAESLAGGHATVAARTAAHATRCPSCRKEVAAMRDSLDFLAQAPPIEPSRDLTTNILLSAQGDGVHLSATDMDVGI